MRQVVDQPVVLDVAVDGRRLAGLDRMDDLRRVLDARARSAACLPAASSASSPRTRGASRGCAGRTRRRRRKYSIASSSRMIHGRYSARVLARLGREAAEPPVQLHPHVPPQRRGRARSPRRAADRDPRRLRSKRRIHAWWFSPRRQECRPPRTARRRTRRAGAWCSGPSGTGRPRAAERGAGVGRPAEHRHGVRVVEQPGVRADVGHVGGRCPARPGSSAAPRKMPPDPERVADRLAQAVARGNLVVEHGRGMAADLDHVDRRSRRRPARAGGRRAPRCSAPRPPPAPCPRDLRRRREPLLIDVVERQGDLAQLGKVSRSPIRSRVNSTLPAPMNAILGARVMRVPRSPRSRRAPRPAPVARRRRREHASRALRRRRRGSTSPATAVRRACRV